MKITALVKRVGAVATVEEIDGDGFRTLIDGWLEAVTLYDGLHPALPAPEDGVVTLWCDEEGKLKNKPVNFVTPWHDPIVGTVVFTEHDEEGELASITKENIQRIREFLGSCGRPVGRGAGITVWEV